MDLSNATHVDPYLEDGNIVLAANGSDGALYIFRIYRGLLCRHSAIFEDMFAVSSSPQSGVHDMYEGAPVVMMHDDAKGLGDLLKMMLDPSSIPLDCLDPKLPLLLEGALKLATKYEVAGVRGRIVEHLETAWPPTFDCWTLQRQAFRALMKEHANPDGKSNGLFFDDRVPEPASAIRIARLYDIPSILPAAYYTLFCRFHHEGDWSVVSTNGSPHLEIGGTSVRTELVDALDLKRIIALQNMLKNRWRQMKYKLTEAMYKNGCVDPNNCVEALPDISERLFVGGWHIGEDVVWRIEMCRRQMCEDLCSECRRAGSELLDAQLRSIWDELPHCLLN